MIPAPTLTLNGGILEWTEVPGAEEYFVICDGEEVWKGPGLTFDTSGVVGTYAVQAYLVTTISNLVTIKEPPKTYSVAFGEGHATWGGGWTTGPGQYFPYPNDVQLEGMTQIGAGSDGTGFVTPDRRLYVCGSNFAGTPGQGYVAVPMQPIYVPTLVTGGVPLYPAEDWINASGEARHRDEGPVGPVIDWHVLAVDGCGTNLFALLDDGKVAAWGGNSYGPLGNGYYGTELEGIYGGANQVVPNMHEDEEAGHFKPQYAPGYVLTSGPPQGGTPLVGVKAISSGHGVTLFLLDDGDVWWTGWLGGTGVQPRLAEELYARPLPEPVRAAVKGAVAIHATHQACLALMPDGSVKAFGTNKLGQFGNGKTQKEEGSGTKVVDVSIADVVAISGGEYHSVFLLRDGTVRACGRDLHGECGQGTISPPGPAYTMPKPVLGLSDVVAIAAAGEPEFGYTTIGASYTLAMKADGSVVGWGANGEGQLCDGTILDKPAPVQCAGIIGALGIAAASTNGKAILAGGPPPPPSLTAIPAERGGVKGALVSWSIGNAPQPNGWHVKSRVAMPEPLTADQIAKGWYRVYQGKMQTSKLLPPETREMFVPYEPPTWPLDPPVPHYPPTLLEIVVAEVSVPPLSGFFKVRTIEVDVG